MPKQALVWGASGGIGSAVVNRLKQDDWIVSAASRSADRNPDSADYHLEFEAQDAYSVNRAIMQIAQQTESLDLTIYATGDIAYDKLADMDAEAWRATIESNLTGAFVTAQQSLPLLRQGGTMVFIGAYVDHLRLPKMGAYAAAKAALAEMVSILAKENRRHNFVIVRPGAVDTSFWDKISLKLPADAKSPDEIAERIVAHVSQEAKGDLNL